MTAPPYLSVIPARGGSKGVPGKNLRPLGGRPLLAWSIEHALAAGDRCRVVVSTDDPAIADVARRAGAEVPFLRDRVLATDEAPTEPVLLDTLDRLQAEGYEPRAVVLLQPTSPVRTPDTVARALDQFEADGADSLVGVVEASPFLWQTSPAGARPLYDAARRPRRQELGPGDRIYAETGSLYVTATDALRRAGNRVAGRVSLFVMSALEAVDVDTELDLLEAAAMLDLMRETVRA